GGTLVTCDMGSLSSLNENIGLPPEPISKQVTIQVRADQPMDRFNTATVGGNLFDPYVFNDTDTVETFVGQADLIINKYGPLAIDAGQPMTYTIVVTNSGPFAATGVQIVDDLPVNLSNVLVLPAMSCQSTGSAQYTCGAYNMSPGEVRTVTITGIAPDQDFIVNRASTSYNFPDLNEEDNTVVFTTTTTLIADLEVVKLADNDYNPSGGETLAGEQLRYFIQLGSLGPSPASGLVVTDTLPPSVEFASATPQPECDGYDPVAHQVVCDMGSLVLGPTINIQINVTPTVPGLITNTVVVSGAQPDPNPNNNADFAVVDVQPADLRLQKLATPSVLVGDLITYTLVVSNAGPSDAFDVVITDTLPVSVTAPVSVQSSSGVCDWGANPIVCTIPEVALDESATITITVLAASEGLAVNEAATTAQDALEVDLATASTVINPVTDLAISKVASGSFYAGEPLTYTLTITNNGPSVARSVRVTDTLPVDATYQNATTPGGACSESGGVVTCVIDIIPPAGTATVTIDTVAGLEGDYFNTADVGGDAFDPDLTNNTTTIVTAILPAADLGIVKSATGTFYAGETFTYTLEVTNNGPSTAQAVVITDSLPADIVFQGASPTSPTCDYLDATHQVVCQPGDLAAGLTTSVTIQVTTTITGSHTNQAETASATADLYPANNSTALSTTIRPVADLSLTKGNATVETVAGQQHTYAITVTNDGPNVASNVTVTDTLPAGMRYDSVSAGVLCTPSDQVVVCNLGSLAVGGSITFEIIADVDSGVAHGAVLTNEATVGAAEADRHPVDNTDTVDTLVVRRADMSITKSDSGDPAIAGETYPYTITVTNLGPSDASFVVVTDTLPALTSYDSSSVSGCTPGSGSVTCNLLPVLASGDTFTFTLTLALNPSLDPSLLVNSSIVNSALVSAAEDDPVSGNDSDDESTLVARLADLRLTKSDDGTPAVVGEEYTYTIVVTNDGPSDASSVSIDDTLPPNTSFVTGTLPYCGGADTDVICDIGDLPFGASTTVTVTMLVEDTAQHGTVVTNTAIVSGDEPDPDFDPDAVPPILGNNEDTEPTDILGKADLGISKSDAGADAYAGDPFVYTITVTNAGPSEATGIVVTDTLPGPMSYLGSTDTCTPSDNQVICSPPGSLASDASTSFLITVTVAASASDSITVTNNAIVSAEQVDRNQANNSASDDSRIVRRTDLAIRKDDGNRSATAGQRFVYTLTVTNTGPSDATGVIVTDTLPADTYFPGSTGGICSDILGEWTCDIGPLPAKQSTAFTISVQVESYVAETTTLVNTAGVTGDQIDPVPGNNTATAETPVERSADVAIFKSGMGVNAIVGEPYTYTLDVSNNGPSDASGVIVIDTIPVSSTFVSATSGCTDGSGIVTCTVGDLADGASDTFTVTIRVDDDVRHGARIVNSAEVSANESDLSSSNNTWAVSTPVTGKADLMLTKTDNDVTAVAGQQLVYTFTVTNNGPSTATAVQVVDTLPDEMSYSGFSGSTVTSCGSNGTIVTCNLAPIDSGLDTTFAMTVTVAASAAHSITVTNTATVSADQFDPIPADNSASDQSTIVRQADLSIVKSGAATAVAGEIYAYTIRIDNAGPSDASGVVVTDTLPANLGVLSVTGANCGSPPLVGPDLTCSTADIPATDFVEITLTVDVPPSLNTGDSLLNRTGVEATEEDLTPADNTDQFTTTVNREVDLLLIKEAQSSTAVVGEPITYTISISNPGPSNATGVVVTDTLPISTSYQTSSIASDCTEILGGAQIRCDIGALDAGQPFSFTVQLLVDPDVAHNTGITNRAAVGAIEFERNETDNTDQDVTTVIRLADLSIDKSDDNSDARAGGFYTYTVSVTNLGPSDADNVVITDTLPDYSSFERATGATCTDSTISVCEFAMLTSGATNVFSITVRFDAGAPHNTTVTNTVQVAADETDPVDTNDLDEEPTVVIRESDVFVSKADNNQPAIAGENYVYTVTVGTLGPSDATGVVLTDTIPLFTSVASAPAGCDPDPVEDSDWRCELGTLFAGASSTELVFTLYVNELAPDGQPITNSAVITANDDDPDQNNNQAEEGTTIERVADLAVVKSDQGNTPVAGQPFSYTISVTNNGPSYASSIEITDTLPVSVTLISATPSCTENGAELDCPLGNPLAPTISTTLTMTVLISETIDHGTTITNTAGVRAAESDPDQSDNTSTVTSVVLGNADLAIEKVGQDTPIAGLAYTYTITVINNGPSGATGVTVVDTLPL
ncbi:MAG: hypothetical protein PVH65_08000, partial [Chloroflexota bacterium]